MFSNTGESVPSPPSPSPFRDTSWSRSFCRISASLATCCSVNKDCTPLHFGSDTSHSPVSSARCAGKIVPVPQGILHHSGFRFGRNATGLDEPVRRECGNDHQERAPKGPHGPSFPGRLPLSAGWSELPRHLDSMRQAYLSQAYLYEQNNYRRAVRSERLRKLCIKVFGSSEERPFAFP